MQDTGATVELRCSGWLARELWPEAANSRNSRQFARDANNLVFSVPVMRVQCNDQGPFLITVDPDAFRMA